MEKPRIFELVIYTGGFLYWHFACSKPNSTHTRLQRNLPNNPKLLNLDVRFCLIYLSHVCWNVVKRNPQRGQLFACWHTELSATRFPPGRHVWRQSHSGGTSNLPTCSNAHCTLHLLDNVILTCHPPALSLHCHTWWTRLPNLYPFQNVFLFLFVMTSLLTWGFGRSLNSKSWKDLPQDSSCG